MSERDLDEGLDAEEGGGLPAFLGDPRGILRRRWRWMLLAVFATAAVASAAVVLLPPRYQASARLLLASQRVPEEFVRQITIETMSEQVNAIVGEILSSSALLALAEEHDYVARTGFEGPQTELLDALHQSITVEPDPEMRSRTESSTTFIFAVRFTAQDARLAADMANGLVAQFTSAHARRQSRQARLTTDFLAKEAERARNELETVRRQIAEYKGLHQGELPSELDTKLARLTRLQQQRDSLAMQISDAEGRLLALRSQGIGDQRSTVLAELRGRLVNELTVHTENHPNVKALQRQVAQLEADLRENPPARSGSASPGEIALEQEVRALRRQMASVEAEIDDLDRGVARIPAHQEKLTALVQQENLLQEKYVEASRKLREAELAESLQRQQQGFSVSVLEPAWPPTQPEIPRILLVLAAIAATLGAGVAAALLLELLDPVLLTSEQLEAASGMPTLGVVPKIR